MTLRGLIRRWKGGATSKSAGDALALNRRGEARRDGLDLISASQSLDVAWTARHLHPWDRGRPGEQERLFTEQCYADTDAALQRLFLEFPEVDQIRFRVLRPDSDEQLLAGSVARSKVTQPAASGASARTRLWQMGVRVSILLGTVCSSLFLAGLA